MTETLNVPLLGIWIGLGSEGVGGDVLQVVDKEQNDRGFVVINMEPSQKSMLENEIEQLL